MNRQKDSKMKCCICGDVLERWGDGIDSYGNNPFPYAKEGRCCDRCNKEIVIPLRIGKKRG